MPRRRSAGEWVAVMSSECPGLSRLTHFAPVGIRLYHDPETLSVLFFHFVPCYLLIMDILSAQAFPAMVGNMQPFPPDIAARIQQKVEPTCTLRRMTSCAML